MAENEDRLLWPGEVAEIAGVDPRTVTFYLSQRGRHEKAERAAGEPAGTRTAYDIPRPATPERVRRQVLTASGAQRTVLSWQWREADILAWRRALAERPAPERSHDPATGKFRAAS